MTVTPEAVDRPERPFDASPGPTGRAGDLGRLEVIVRRPDVDVREILTSARLEREVGLVGDTWRARSSPRMPDGGPDPDAQVTLMSVRVLAAIEPDAARWPMAGDQLLVDLDLSVESLPPGTRLGVGAAVLEVTPAPHTGCAKFSSRFGSDALRWINSPEGRLARRRGMNTRVVLDGAIRAGDAIRRL